MSAVKNILITENKSTKKPAKKTAGVSFPKQELNEWLSSRISWDHNDWSCLMSDLRNKGYMHLTDNQEGQNTIGIYLENTRRR